MGRLPNALERASQIYVCVCLLALGSVAFGQTETAPRTFSRVSESSLAAHPEPTEVAESFDSAARQRLVLQIENLSSNSYRTREMANWYLRREPRIAIPLISERLLTSKITAATEMIAILSHFATNPDGTLGFRAQQILEATARNGSSAVALLATNSVQSIANVQEAQSIEVLTHLGMNIGYPELMVNGAKLNDPQSEAVCIAWVNAEFDGKPEDIQRMRFLQHVTLVYLQDITVTDSLLRAICQMPNVKGLVLREVKLEPESLLLLSQMKNFDHFELAYVNVGDDAVDILETIPVWGTMRLFGTKLSLASADRLRKKFSGLAFYFGKGGYLGVGTMPPNTTVVQSVQAGSGAAEAGIMLGDRLVAVGEKPIKSFEDLRAELAFYGAGEYVKIHFLRKGERNQLSVRLTEMPASHANR